MVETVQTIQHNGMQVMAGFIVGFDSDSSTTFDAQIRFIQQVGIVTAMVGLLTALPQTRLWRRLREEERLIETASGDNTLGFLNFIPRMPVATLMQGYRRIVGSLYSRRMYYKRIHIFLEQYNPTVRTHVTWTDIKALIKSMFHIGLVSFSSPLYWRLVFSTMLTNIKAMPMVIELAICGQHFIRMRKRILSEAGWKSEQMDF